MFRKVRQRMLSWSQIWKLSWSEGKRQRGQLLLFMSSIILGIAAVVAINSFNDNLLRDIDRQTATLIGADLRLSSNKPIPADLLTKLKSGEGEMAEQWDLLTMAYFPGKEEGQFVRLRGSEQGFPFYGKIVTDPASAAGRFHEENQALVDEGLMESLELEIGDSIRLGALTLPIIGRLSSTDGGAAMASSFAPGVRISLEQLRSTGLIRAGSLVNYSAYKSAPTEVIESWMSENQDAVMASDVEMESVADRKEQLGEAFSFLNLFLNLVALVALVLGCIGVGSSVFIYMKRKEGIIAILRCMGMSSGDVSKVFFVQIFSWGALSVVIGALLGSMIQWALPVVFAGILPYEVDFQISGSAIMEGLVTGWIIVGLFCLMPLVNIKNVTALRALRPSFTQKSSSRSFLQVVLGGLVAFTLWTFLWYLTADTLLATYFILGLAFTFGILYGASVLITRLVKRFLPRSLGFTWRQGLANLFRPQNRTSLLMMSIGTGVAIIGVLIIIQSLLLHNVESMGQGEQPNVVLYGIESNQLEDVQRMTDSLNMPVIQSVPVVTVDLSGWKGKTKAQWKQDSTSNLEDWVTRRETRVSYRNHLEDNEELIKGTFPRPYSGDSIWISLGDGYAEALEADIGDEVVFDVQGVRMKTYVGSIRKIDFANLQARFFILFPEGILEQAPQFHVMVSKTGGGKATSLYRNQVAAQFPNVSVVDLSSILAAVTDLLNKVSYVIRFMAGFSIITGFIVLISALLLSKFQRMKDSVLLRTLGASQATIVRINMIEYALIGFFSALLGMMISLILAYLLSTLQLGLSFQVDGLSIVMVMIVVTLVTALIGFFTGKEVTRSSPMEVLKESEI